MATSATESADIIHVSAQIASCISLAIFSGGVQRIAMMSNLVHQDVAEIKTAQ